jgi:hypothetical protein
VIGALTPVTFLLGGKFYRSIGLLMRRHYGLCQPGEEGIFWCRGWRNKNIAALRVAHALRASAEPLVLSMPFPRLDRYFDWIGE